MRGLGHDGVVLRAAYPTVPARVDDRLTETGTGLTRPVKALADWSLTHRAAIAEARHAYAQATPTMTSAERSTLMVCGSGRRVVRRCPEPVGGTGPFPGRVEGQDWRSNSPSRAPRTKAFHSAAV